MNATDSKDTTKTVWKFGLRHPDSDIFEIAIPRGATVLDVQMQAGIPCIWTLVNPDAPKEVRTFRIAGTGHPIDDEIKAHVGTFQINSLGLVFHVFEVDC